MLKMQRLMILLSLVLLTTANHQPSSDLLDDDDGEDEQQDQDYGEPGHLGIDVIKVSYSQLLQEAGLRII